MELKPPDSLDLRMSLTFRKLTLPTLICVFFSAGGWSDESSSAQHSAESAETRTAAVTGLKPLGMLVGEWRGVGQPRRGSRVGAWLEQAQAAWDFSSDQAKLVFTSDADKQFQSVRFGWDPAAEAATAVVLPAGSDEVQRYVTDPETSRDMVHVFVSVTDGDDPQSRLTLRRLSDIRVTLLFERRTSATASWRRVAEVGYTRAGRKLATVGAGSPQCIVTGGLGSMTVSHNDKTYYVCCEGCRQAFDADPEGTIEAYRERLAEAKK
jgi:hypothetical protein